MNRNNHEASDQDQGETGIDVDPNTVCRICTTTEDNLLNLFARTILNGELLQIPEMISDCLQIRVDRNDKLPTKLCNACKTNVTQFYVFKQKSQRTDQLLNSMIPLSISNFEDKNEGYISPMKQTSVEAAASLPCNRVSISMNLDLDFDPQAMCRICMASEDNLLNLFARTILNGEQLLLPEIISDCLQIRIDRTDKLPAKLCKTCKTDVTLFYSFKQKSQRTDRLLLSMITPDQAAENFGKMSAEQRIVKPASAVVKLECVDGDDVVELATTERKCRRVIQDYKDEFLYDSDCGTRTKNTASNYTPRHRGTSANIWTPEKKLQLVEQVRMYETIWNVASDSYKSREIKEQAWDSVANALQLDKNECKNRWNATRVGYRTAVKNERSTKIGQAAMKRRKRNPVYNEMSFLENIVLMDREDRQSNLISPSPHTPSSQSGQSSPVSHSFTDEDTSIHPDMIEVELQSPTSSPLAKHRKANRQNRQKYDSQDQNERQAIFKSAMQTLHESRTSDDFDVFGQFIASNLRSWNAIDHNRTGAFKDKLLELLLENSRAMREVEKNSCQISFKCSPRRKY